MEPREEGRVMAALSEYSKRYREKLRAEAA